MHRFLLGGPDKLPDAGRPGNSGAAARQFDAGEEGWRNHPTGVHWFTRFSLVPRRGLWRWTADRPCDPCAVSYTHLT
ncbi:MAG: hypothetical protein QUU85_18685, partial [Candidatus Eisenbacteria bacterium]|nr:hypothetical protein [Candidatus Eisenbacteria bacterium]